MDEKKKPFISNYCNQLHLGFSRNVRFRVQIGSPLMKEGLEVGSEGLGENHYRPQGAFCGL